MPGAPHPLATKQESVHSPHPHHHTWGRIPLHELHGHTGGLSICLNQLWRDQYRVITCPGTSFPSEAGTGGMQAGVPKFHLPLHGQQRYTIQFASLLNLPGDMQIKLYTVLLIANFAVGTCPSEGPPRSWGHGTVQKTICMCVCVCVVCLYCMYASAVFIRTSRLGVLVRNT
jgi:hypothetical protein